MDKELTAMDRKSSDHRIACSDDQSSSTMPRTIGPLPNRALESDLQGAQIRYTPIGKIWPTTIVAPCTGGASQSKWTRKTQPWNTMAETIVVASSPTDKSHVDHDELMPKRRCCRCGPCGLSALTMFSDFTKPEAIAGRIKGDSCDLVARKGSRIYGSSVRRAFGRGRPAVYPAG